MDDAQSIKGKLSWIQTTPIPTQLSLQVVAVMVIQIVAYGMLELRRISFKLSNSRFDSQQKVVHSSLRPR